MATLKDLENAHQALSDRWEETLRCAKEGEKARELLGRLGNPQGKHVLKQKIERMKVARDNYFNSVKLAQKVIDEYYEQQLP